MRADTQLEYAIFQLTPTRTRCELHVVTKGFTYKLASGLLKPFISHLKAAEEQLARGGYSIRLEPPDPARASWFTKGTMERFVRFVSTPEVLERVSSVEVELLELEETTRQQTTDSNESNGAGQTDNIASKPASTQLSPGAKPVTLAASEKVTKATSEGVENGVEESTKQRLLRALDARRMMLQKEQGMAFARALAAGFNLENMDDLVLFAECFGANRLREACIKFLALCKKRQEAGLGLEDLELLAAENAQSEMFMGAMGGSSMGLSWPDPHGNGLDQLQSPAPFMEGKPSGGEDGNEKLTRRGSLDEASKEYWQSGSSLRPANGSGMMGDGDGGPGIVNGHPMMAGWQGQPHSQYMPGVHPYGAMHPGMPNHFDPSYGFAGPARPGQPGLPYPHYLGSPYMPPPYPDSNGWQAHSGVPPPYWPGNQTHDPADGGHPRPLHQQTISTPSPREKDVHDSAKYAGDDMHDDREEFSTEFAADRTRRPARRSASPRRRSASPMRKVQIGRSGGSKRSGMVVIRNINYIAPKAQQQDNKEDDDLENSDSWSEDGESDGDGILKSRAESLRASIEDAVGLVEGKDRATKDGKRKHSKKEKRKVSSMDAARGVDDDADPDDDDGHEKNMAKQTEDAWMLGKREKGAGDSKNLLPEEALFSVNRVRQQGLYDPALESTRVEKQGREDARESGSTEDSALLSQRDGYVRTSQSPSFDMFEQEHQESKKTSVVDDSYIIANSRSTTIAKSSTTMEPDFDFSSKVTEHSQAGKRLSDDSFIVLDRSAAREGANGEWRRPLNLESEMPSDQNLDVCDPAQKPESFEPYDLFMVPERSQDTYKRAWNTPLDYDMHVLAADMMDNGHESQDKEDEDGDAPVEPDVYEEEIEAKSIEPNSRKLSEKDAKAKAMKEMLERRKSTGGGRPGRPNPLAEAQLRAEKLRIYKAGLQKSKKEKEEEERKRIEDLRNQRQQRIAARSNPGGGPSSPSLSRGARTTPLTGNKSSPKTPNKLSSGSALSPSLSRDRVANVNRAARPTLDSPKSGENAVSRSVSSLTELHRESKKTSSVVRASTGSQLSSHNLRSEKVTDPHSKINGRIEDKLGRSKSSRTDEKVSRTDSGLAEERIRRSESARLEEKIGRTESGREDKVGHSDSGRIVEKGQTSTPKTVNRIAPQDVPTVAVKPVRSLSTDNRLVKKASTIQTVPLKPAVKKRNAVAPAAAVEEIIIEQKALPLPQKEQPKVERSPSPIKATEHENSNPENGESNENANGANNESENGHAEIILPALMVAEVSISKNDKISHENGVFIPNTTVTVLEESKEDASPIGLSFRAESGADSDDRELEVEAGSSVGEDYHAPVAHVSPSEDNPTAFTEAHLHANNVHLVGHYSPPFAPPSEYSLSPSVNLPHLNPAVQREFTMEVNSTDSSTTRSRKKWGDSKAKGLKRLLLLGRKSGRSSAQNASDITSEGDEEDSPSSNGKNSNIKFASDLDSFNDQAGAVLAQSDVGSVQSSSKGSRSIFSLSTFRGKSTAKA